MERAEVSSLPGTYNLSALYKSDATTLRLGDLLDTLMAIRLDVGHSANGIAASPTLSAEQMRELRALLDHAITTTKKIFGSIHSSSASPTLSATTKAVYGSWGKGKYDPRFNQDGNNGLQVIPPAYGLAGIHRVTSTGDGEDLAYWNRYVGVTQMGGHGSLSERRTGVNVTNGPDDLITSKLVALQAYQLTLKAPSPSAGSFDAVAAEPGKLVFNGPGACAGGHSGVASTDADSRLHPASEEVSEPGPNGAASYASPWSAAADVG